MKTRIIIIASILFAISYSAHAQSFDFRKARWGMDSIQVKNSEQARFITSKNNWMMFSGKMENMDTKIYYYFTSSNQLYRSYYLINMDSRNPSLYVNTFLLLQQLLTEKYHEPFSKSAITINGKIITQDEWASNLISDNLNLETKWKTDKTEIILSLYSISDEMYMEISYTSVVYAKKSDQETRAKILNDL